MKDKEKLAQWMIQRGYATGHGDSMEDLLQELDWQIAENWNRALINGITTEREACAELCDRKMSLYWMEFDRRGDDEYRSAALALEDCAEAIRARGKQ